MKQCPKCRVELQSRNIGAVSVDECRKCRGVWFDKDELRQAKDATDSDLNWMDFEIWKHEDKFKANTSGHQCPVCQKPMATLEYDDTNVQIDYCPSCSGTWLDRHEFKKIVATLERELLAKPFADYVKEAVREGIEVLTGHESFLSEWKDFATVLRLMQYRLFVEKPGLLSNIQGIQKSVQ
jgi:Zn-finger nucleic acid-binding protein